jgi:lipopolysaccharide/colanic/teichoic acid biosynthesis glycosyltransferase
MMKRLFDILFSLGGLVALSPILFIVSAIIKMTSPGPVFFVRLELALRESRLVFISSEQ